MHYNSHSSELLSRAYYYAQGSDVYGPHSLLDLNNLVAAERLSIDVLVAASGDENWVPLRSLLSASGGSEDADSAGKFWKSPSAQKGLFSFLDCISGLPAPKALPWKEIVKKSLAVNSESDAEAIFLAGSNEESVPWVFSRILIGGLIAMAALLWALSIFNNDKLIPGFFFVGCVTVPFATLSLLVELCPSSKLNGYHVSKSVVVGGLLSILFTLVLSDLPLVSSFAFTPMLAGPVEETAKLAAAVLIAHNWSQARSAQDGIVLGASVGAGFAIIETAGYIFESFIVVHDRGVVLDWHGAIGILALRAMMSPFAHVLWTAVVVGALWHVSRGSKFKLSGLYSHVFLRIFIFIIGLHAFWNSPFFLPFADTMTAIVGKYALIGLSGWYLLLQLSNTDEMNT